MKTTKPQRALAVRVASAVTAGYEPTRDELETMALTITDCHAVFLIHAPAIASIKKCIDARGNVPRDYQEIFQRELVPAVRELYRFEAREGL